jgi:hypothetical protein
LSLSLQEIVTDNVAGTTFFVLMVGPLAMVLNGRGQLVGHAVRVVSLYEFSLTRNTLFGYLHICSLAKQRRCLDAGMYVLKIKIIFIKNI